jgi:hypothetical protein
MINVKSKKCIICNIIYPSFNYSNEKTPLYCHGCKLDNMINVINKKCFKCHTKFPSYNYQHIHYALYCGDCKLPNMINIKSKKCITCKIRQANYNYIDKKVLYCSDCKIPDMINIKWYNTKSGRTKLKRKLEQINNEKRVKPNWHKIETLI